MLGGVVIALVLALWGAQAAVPWRLRGVGSEGGEGSEGGDRDDAHDGDHEPRRRWAYAALPLLLTAILATLLYLRARPDAAVAAGLSPLLANVPGRILAILTAALLASDLLLALTRGRLERQGWAIAAALGLASLAATSLSAELLRVGEGPASPAHVLLLAAACRLLVGLAAGEVLAPGRPLLALAAGLALPLYPLLLPAELRRLLAAGGGWLPLAASAVLFLAARFLPPSLRRAGLAGGVLLAGLFFGLTAELSQTLAGRPLPPLPPLPG